MGSSASGPLQPIVTNANDTNPTSRIFMAGSFRSRTSRATYGAWSRPDREPSDTNRKRARRSLPLEHDVGGDLRLPHRPHAHRRVDRDEVQVVPLHAVLATAARLRDRGAGGAVRSRRRHRLWSYAKGAVAVRARRHAAH